MLNMIKGEKMNGYICVWDGKEIEVRAETSYKAQCIAEKEFQKGTRKNVKGYNVMVVLCEKDGEQVVHSTGGLQ